MSNRSELREQILERVKATVLSSVQHLPVKVYLFGSWAKGEERRTSDIDVAIWADFSLPIELLTELRLSLEESTIPYRVDIVDLTRTDQPFVQKVKQEGVVWKD